MGRTTVVAQIEIDDPVVRAQRLGDAAPVRQRAEQSVHDDHRQTAATLLEVQVDRRVCPAVCLRAH
jgi:hypothetical protein